MITRLFFCYKKFFDQMKYLVFNDIILLNFQEV